MVVVVRPRPPGSRAGPVVGVSLIAVAAVALVLAWKGVSRPEPASPSPAGVTAAGPREGDAVLDIPFDRVQLDDPRWFMMELAIAGEWTEARTRALFLARALLVREYVESGGLQADYPDATGRRLGLRVTARGARDRLARMLVAESVRRLAAAGITLALDREQPDPAGPKLLPDFLCVEQERLVVGLVAFRRWTDGMVEEIRRRLDDHRRSLKFGTWKQELPETAQPEAVRFSLFTLFQPRAEDLAALDRMRKGCARQGLEFEVQRLEPGPGEREFLVPRTPQ